MREWIERSGAKVRKAKRAGQKRAKLREVGQESNKPFIKINYDASFRAETRNGGWGMIDRDSTTDICVAASGPLQPMADPLHAEASALSNAIQIADQMGYENGYFLD